MFKEDVCKVCFLGSARYSKPLDQTTAKKFYALRVVGDLFVVGFSQDWFPHRFSQQAHFYLLPQLPGAMLRYLEMFTGGVILALWLIFRQEIQIIVAQSPYDGVAGALAKQIAGWFGRSVALLVESHGDFEESLFLYRRIFLQRLYRFLMQQSVGFTLRQADVLRAISQVTRQQLERWNVRKPIFQFAAWTDMQPFLEAGGTQKPRVSATVLYAGVITPLKGVLHLVKAFAAIAAEVGQAQLVIIGKESNSAYAAEVKAQAQRLGLNGRIRFMAELPQVELAQWMAQACVLVLPSLSEGLGRVLVEAMATGTPVIGSRVGGIPDIIQDNVTGFLIPPGDEVALAEKLRWVVTHPLEAQAMGQKASTFARAFFSTEQYVQGYRQMFAAAQARSGV